MRLITLGAASALTLGLAGCGSVSSAVKEPSAKPVELKVSGAKFSQTKQVPGDEVTFSLIVENTGDNPAPNLIVYLDGLADSTVEDPQSNRLRTSPTDLPNDTKRAPWFVDSSPYGPPFSASSLYPGGPLAPGRTRALRWQLSAVVSGTHTVKYEVWSGLSKNEAKATSGMGLTGSVSATIAKK